MAKEESLASVYKKVAEKKWGIQQPPPKDEVRACRNCAKSTFHQWVNGNIKDPMICQCMTSGEWNMASTPMEYCFMYAYDPKWKERMKKPEIHIKK